jgi:hypothetical protein
MGVLILPSYYTPEEVLAKYINGEITLEDATGELKTMRGYYEGVSRGGEASRKHPVTPEEAAEKIGAVENAIETLRAILYPPKLQIDLSRIRDKLRGIRDKCIAGDCTQEAALALFDQAWLDFKNDTTLNACLKLGVSQQSALLQEIWQGIENAGAMDIINRIRAEIEGIQEPAPDPQVPERKAEQERMTDLKEPAPDTHTPEPELPLDQDLEALCEDEKPVLRRWLHGKYKCKSLPDFINAYAIRTARNPTKNQIKDYIVKENGEDYTEKTITTNLSSYGISPERKKAEKRRPQGKHRPGNNFT